MSRKMTVAELPSFLWKLADLLRGPFKASEYGSVILPFTLLRRIDCVITKPAVAAAIASYIHDDYPILHPELQPGTPSYLLDLESKLQTIPGVNLAAFNLSAIPSLTVASISDNSQALHADLTQYLAGFSPSIQDIFINFDLARILERLTEAGLLKKVLNEFLSVDLSPEHISNSDMGVVFEELIRKFADSVNEAAGQFYTPRDIVQLLAHTLVDPVNIPVDSNFLLYDPTCGTGGILSVTEEVLASHGVDPTRVVHYGQEIQQQSYAICKADMLLKGQDPGHIKLGNTLTDDQLATTKFKFMGANPPFGDDWKKHQAALKADSTGRFSAGLPRTSDGSMLFIQHLIHKMDPEGSRVGVVLHGSPLFTGDAGSGESNIRKYILENDLLDALIALPTDMFYNTSIPTYLWILDNKKPEHRQHKVQLIDATRLATKMKKSLGSKRAELSADDTRLIVEVLRDSFEKLAQDLTADEVAADRFVLSRMLSTTDFGFRQVTIEVPLTPERQQELLESGKLKESDIKKSAKTGVPLFDPDMRDTENVPLSLVIETWEQNPELTTEEATALALQTFLVDNIHPHLPTAVISTNSKHCDPVDKLPGILGFSINFPNFLPSPPPNKLTTAELSQQILQLQADLSELLKKIL